MIYLMGLSTLSRQEETKLLKKLLEENCSDSFSTMLEKK